MTRKKNSMQIKLFNIPITDNGIALSELNHFLASHKVLEVEQHFYQNEKACSWNFCVRYINGLPNSDSSFNKAKTDYKAILNEHEFSVFSTLREYRKTIASNDAVPAYAVFTDEELANIARLPSIGANELITIKGIGEKKVEKYGKLLVEMYCSKKDKQ